MFKLLLFSSLLFSSLISIGQSSNQIKTFEGFYRGDKLKIQCRTSQIKPWNECDCLDSVLVNSKRTSTIDLDEFELNLNTDDQVKIYEPIKIAVHYRKGYQLRILNPNQFFPKEILPVEGVEIDNNNIIHWQTLQNFPDLRLWAQIEQKKWDEWIKIGPNFNILDEKKYAFDLSPFLNKGENEFRVVVANIDYEFYPSAPKNLDVKKKKAKVKYKKKLKKLVFNEEQNYIFYNHRKDVIKRGFGTEIDTKNQEAGDYSVQYANRTYYFKIK